MRETLINGRWPVRLPDHRADFHEAHPWWEAARLADMFDKLEPGQLIIDVGSEEGDLSALYGTWGLDVFAIDPSWPWQVQTVETFLANGMEGLESYVGLADYYTDEKPEMSDKRGFHTASENVPRAMIDELVARHDLEPAALTIDVEGHEYQVLQGAMSTLVTMTRNVWVSIHGDVDPHAETPSKVHELMRSWGFADQFLAYDHEWHYRFYR